MKTNIPNYKREFELPSKAGSVARFIFYLSATIFLIAGIVVAVGEQQVSSIRSEVTFEFSLFLPFLVYALIAYATGYVSGRLVDIQHLKLQLLEIQTSQLFPDRRNMRKPEEPKMVEPPAVEEEKEENTSDQFR